MKLNFKQSIKEDIKNLQQVPLSLWITIFLLMSICYLNNQLQSAILSVLLFSIVLKLIYKIKKE